MIGRVCRAVVWLALGVIAPASAVAQVGPLDVSGELDGAPFRVVVPVSWNGTLLVYAHGYRDKADHPGEIDNRTPDIAPSGALATALLAQGYALAGTAYGDNGWAVDEAMHDVRALVAHVRETVASPRRTILVGVSLGGMVALKTMEQATGLFDGAIAGCTVAAGATANWDASADLLLAYDTVFGMPPSWGTPGDVRDDIDFDTEVLAKLVPELSTPVNFARFEFVRLVAGTPGTGIVPPPPPAFYPGWAITDLYFATEARAELERRAQGPVVQNLDRTYALAPAERAYLNALGVPDAVIDGWLATMNASRDIDAPAASRSYLRHHTDYSGRLKKPVLTLHTIVDPLVPVSQHERYAGIVAAAGRDDLLAQAFTSGNGHCNFTGPQILSTLAAMEIWLNTGVKPGAATLPAGLGFVPGFVPPPMPQP